MYLRLEFVYKVRDSYLGLGFVFRVRDPIFKLIGFRAGNITAGLLVRSGPNFSQSLFHAHRKMYRKIFPHFA